MRYISLVLLCFVLIACQSVAPPQEASPPSPKTELGSFGLSIVNESTLSLSPQATLGSSDLDFAITNIRFSERISENGPLGIGKGRMSVEFVFRNKRAYPFHDFDIKLLDTLSVNTTSAHYISITEGAKDITNLTPIANADLPSDNTLAKVSAQDSAKTVSFSLEVIYTASSFSIYVDLAAIKATQLRLSNNLAPLALSTGQTLGKLFSLETELMTNLSLTAGRDDTHNGSFQLLQDSNTGGYLLKNTTPLNAASYSIRLKWQGQNGSMLERSFMLKTIPVNSFIPNKRVGDFAFLGQDAADLRTRNPDRNLSFSTYDSYYFDTLGYVIDICRSTDTVMSVRIGKTAPEANALSNVKGITFASSLANIRTAYGTEASSTSIFGYTSYFYPDSNNALQSTSYGFVGTDLQDISVSNRFCP